MQHPKVVVIGAGSLFFGRQAVWQMIHSKHLQMGTLGLVDTNTERLEKMSALARKVVEHTDVPLAVEASVERKDVLKDADFVVLSFADRGVHFRGVDCDVSSKYGIRMCSGDTIGPGGIFRALREFPVILECTRDIEQLCPSAWVINYINPTAVGGIGLRRHTPKLKSFALCSSQHMPHIKIAYAKRAGIIKTDEEFTGEIDKKFDLRIAGVNHFTWMLKAEFDGRDVTGAIAETIRRQAATEGDGGDTGAKAEANDAIGYALYEVFGYIPTVVGHTKEYVRFWQGLGRSTDPVGMLDIWQTGPRYERHDEMWRQVDGFLDGTIPIGDYMSSFGPDHATDIIESIVADLGKPFYINTFNDGAVTNMADDAYLELLCDIDADGIRPRPVGEFPRGLRSLTEQVLDTHELTVEAAVTCRRDILRKAMLTDPLAVSIADADAMIEELLEAEKDALPKKWFDYPQGGD
ncbi:MAG: glycoside hydrolase family 4 [Planctomycetota bacterium]|nr:glycoside hydrolase family 4 [Planctomycetota bacterium]